MITWPILRQVGAGFGNDDADEQQHDRHHHNEDDDDGWRKVADVFAALNEASLDRYKRAAGREVPEELTMTKIR